MTSSTIRIPNTVSRTTPVTRCSANVRVTIVVLEMATMAPATSDSSVVQPKSDPAVKPSANITLDSASAASPDVAATRITCPSRNSSPRAYMRRTTPSSENSTTMSRSTASGIGT